MSVDFDKNSRFYITEQPNRMKCRPIIFFNKLLYFNFFQILSSLLFSVITIALVRVFFHNQLVDPLIDVAVFCIQTNTICWRQ